MGFRRRSYALHEDCGERLMERYWPELPKGDRWLGTPEYLAALAKVASDLKRQGQERVSFVILTREQAVALFGENPMPMRAGPLIPIPGLKLRI